MIVSRSYRGAISITPSRSNPIQHSEPPVLKRALSDSPGIRRQATNCPYIVPASPQPSVPSRYAFGIPPSHSRMIRLQPNLRTRTTLNLLPRRSSVSRVSSGGAIFACIGACCTDVIGEPDDAISIFGQEKDRGEREEERGGETRRKARGGRRQRTRRHCDACEDVGRALSFADYSRFDFDILLSPWTSTSKS